jgi:hypothetical protein
MLLALYLVACVSVGFLVNGLPGACVATLAGSALAFVALVLFRLSGGGLIPRKLREETAMDFIESHGPAVDRAYPEATAFERQERVCSLLEEVVRPAWLKLSGPRDHVEFFRLATLVAMSQPTLPRKSLALDLIAFLKTHRLWYGSVRATEL